MSTHPCTAPAPSHQNTAADAYIHSAAPHTAGSVTYTYPPAGGGAFPVHRADVSLLPPGQTATVISDNRFRSVAATDWH